MVCDLPPRDTLDPDRARRGPRALAALALAWLIGLGSLGCGSAEPLGKSEANPLDGEESNLLAELNQTRKEAGIPSVTVCNVLNESTSAHSDDMRDTGYLKDTAPDGAAPRARACAAGYMAACDSNLAMAEAVASGSPLGEATFSQWMTDESTKALLLDPALLVAGVGRSLGGKAPLWTLDLAAVDEPSCH
jgi:uncharacterized protein YkwD